MQPVISDYFRGLSSPASTFGTFGRSFVEPIRKPDNHICFRTVIYLKRTRPLWLLLQTPNIPMA